jgi:anti-anti-sigma factor
MPEPYRQLEVEHVADVVCVRLRHARLDLGSLDELILEMDRLVDETACRKMVISLGPEEPECMYSLFLAKLVSLQKRLQMAGGSLTIAEASEDVQKIFEVCRLKSLFDFKPSRNEALAALRQ